MNDIDSIPTEGENFQLVELCDRVGDDLDFVCAEIEGCEIR